MEGERKVRMKMMESEMEVGERAAKESELIRNLIEDLADDQDLIVPVPAVEPSIMEMVMEYCSFHAHANSNNTSKQQVHEWDAEFARKAFAADEKQATISHILMAAQHLQIHGLFHLSCATIAHWISHKSVPEIRAIFKKQNDFTREEEKRILKETRWVDDPVPATPHRE